MRSRPPRKSGTSIEAIVVLWIIALGLAPIIEIYVAIWNVVALTIATLLISAVKVNRIISRLAAKQRRP